MGAKQQHPPGYDENNDVAMPKTTAEISAAPMPMPRYGASAPLKIMVGYDTLAATAVNAVARAVPATAKPLRCLCRARR